VIEAIILVGGEGRRLRPLTDTRPKPMMPLVDRPFVAHQLDGLRRFGVTDVIFSCGYRPEALEQHFGDGTGIGMRLRYVVDPEPLGTAGAVKNAEPLLRGERTLVLNGDILTDLDLADLLDHHVAASAAGTLALTPVEDPSRYGLVRLHPDRTVKAFLEKPQRSELRDGEPFLINAGTYLLEREALDMIPAAASCSIERDIFPVLAAAGRLTGHPSDCYWLDIGTPESYLQAHLDVLAGSVRTAAPIGDRYVGDGTVIAAGAVVDGGSTVGRGGRVGEGATVRGSVVGDAADVGAGARIEGAIIGAGVTVGDEAAILPGSVIGDGAVIAAGLELRGVTVATGARVHESPTQEGVRSGLA
jgi:mannose-1-phosphate guanylyltransferase